MNNIVNINIDYTFFNDYIDNPYFNNCLNQRIKKVDNDNHINSYKTNNIINDCFVKIFSCTVIPKNLLFHIDSIIHSHVPNYTLIDPCSGNSFHTFLFSIFCNRQVITIDIQVEKCPWIYTIETDGLSYLLNSNLSFQDKVLLLSWIDNDDLSFSILNAFHGDIVISIGNYDISNSPTYLKQIYNHFTLLHHFNLYMPWDSIENIRIFKRINIK